MMISHFLRWLLVSAVAILALIVSTGGRSGVGCAEAAETADQPWADDWDAGFLYKVAIRGTTRVRLFEISGNEEVQIVTL